MQKIIRATERAKSQAQRKLTAEQAQNRKIERKMRMINQQGINSEVRARIMAARTARREDWLMGPLAPRRDVGNAKDTYGTVDVRQLRALKKAMDERKDWCIREGDRVVVIAPKHRDRGKIGKVTSVRAEADECTVEGLNLVSRGVFLHFVQNPTLRCFNFGRICQMILKFRAELLIQSCSRPTW